MSFDWQQFHAREDRTPAVVDPQRRLWICLAGFAAALLVVFAIRLAKTKKFMPSGLMLVLTVLALALRNLFKG